MRRLPFSTSLHAAAFFLAACGVVGLPVTAQAQQARVSVSITMTGDSGEVIGAWRRAKGMDPPDADADRRYAELIQRVRGSHAHAPGIDPQRAAMTMTRLLAATPPVPQLRALRVASRP